MFSLFKLKVRVKYNFDLKHETVFYLLKYT